MDAHARCLSFASVPFDFDVQRFLTCPSYIPLSELSLWPFQHVMFSLTSLTTYWPLQSAVHCGLALPILLVVSMPCRRGATLASYDQIRSGRWVLMSDQCSNSFSLSIAGIGCMFRTFECTRWGASHEFTKRLTANSLSLVWLGQFEST